MSKTAVLGLLGLAAVAALVAFLRTRGGRRAQRSTETESSEQARADGTLPQVGAAIRPAILTPSEKAERSELDEDPPNPTERSFGEGRGRTYSFEFSNRSGAEGGEARNASPEMGSVIVTRELDNAALITGFDSSEAVGGRVDGDATRPDDILLDVHGSTARLGAHVPSVADSEGGADAEVEQGGSQHSQYVPLVDSDDSANRPPESGSGIATDHPTPQSVPEQTYLEPSVPVAAPNVPSEDAQVTGTAREGDIPLSTIPTSAEGNSRSADDLPYEPEGKAYGLKAEVSTAPDDFADEGLITRTDASEFASETAGVEPCLDPANEASEPPSAREMSSDAAAEESPRQRRYRVVSRNPVVARPRTRRETTATLARGAKVDVRLLFRRGGTCTVSLVPRRSNLMPAHVAVSLGGHSLDLVEMQDGWYEDVFPVDIGAQLTAGIAWQGRSDDGQVFRWALGGRDVFVLAPHGELGGYVDTNRLLLNQEHAVLCTEAAENPVQVALQDCGGPPTQRLAASEGAPAGWVVLKGVVPHRPVSPNIDTDPLDCLRPASGAQVVLEGGVRVQANVWLRGFPPIIRVNGEEEEVHQLLIDGRPAAKRPDGGYAAQGWDQAGLHFIASTVGNFSYSILEPDHNWPAWPAHRWTLGEDETTPGLTSRPAICGALVMPPGESASVTRSVVVPMTNVLLLGSAPGQVEICKSLADRTSREVVGFPSFEPVWAVPLDPMHCDRKSNSVILLSAIPPTALTVARMSKQSKQSKLAIRAWCAAVLAASRKRLPTAPNDETTLDLWSAYRTAARLLHRRTR